MTIETHVIGDGCSAMMLASRADELQGHNITLVMSLILISEPTRPLSTSYAVFCLQKKDNAGTQTQNCRPKSQ